MGVCKANGATGSENQHSSKWAMGLTGKRWQGENDRFVRKVSSGVGANRQGGRGAGRHAGSTKSMPECIHQQKGIPTEGRCNSLSASTLAGGSAGGAGNVYQNTWVILRGLKQHLGKTPHETLMVSHRGPGMHLKKGQQTKHHFGTEQEW
jgi:hypothetical protein